jgi:Rod binding domain-containing protein
MSRVDGPIQRQAMAAYVAAGRAAAGTREAKARAAADGFESVFVQNMLETVFSGLGEEGPLGSGSAGGGAWRGLYAQELSKTMAKGGGLGIAPAVYREMFRGQEIRPLAAQESRP